MQVALLLSGSLTKTSYVPRFDQFTLGQRFSEGEGATMEKRIYAVQFEEKWPGDRSWLLDSINVFSDGDMHHAIAKAKKHVLSQRITDVKGREQKCSKFRVLGVTVAATARI